MRNVIVVCMAFIVCVGCDFELDGDPISEPVEPPTLEKRLVTYADAELVSVISRQAIVITPDHIELSFVAPENQRMRPGDLVEIRIVFWGNEIDNEWQMESVEFSQMIEVEQ